MSAYALELISSL